MAKRRMVTVTKEKSGPTQATVGIYRVSPKLKEFELLPKPGAKTVVAPTSAPIPVTAVVKPSTDNLTVKEAHALYLELHAMFGQK